MTFNILQFFAGAVLLYYGAEFLIIGSKSIADKFNISPLIIGITLVAFGTSLPELIVSIIAILKDDPGIVVGNVVGSNIANIGLVLGVTALEIQAIGAEGSTHQAVEQLSTKLNLTGKQMAQSVGPEIPRKSLVELFQQEILF